MCDNNFEFDENDDALLSALLGEIDEANTPLKRHSQSFAEQNSSKRQKNDEPPNLESPSFERKKLVATTPTIVKRIFPGPAGILSDKETTLTSSQTELCCTQNTAPIFQDGPWEEMSKDFKLSSTLHLYDKFSISWLKKEALANQFAVQKAPFLAGILVSLEVSEGKSKSVNVTLKDMTGSIQGNIFYDLYEEYASQFTLGSVLILVQFGVLSCTCDKCDNYHLTVTRKNLSAIYNSQGKFVINKIDPQKVLVDFCEQKKQIALDIRNRKRSMPGRRPEKVPVGSPSCSITSTPKKLFTFKKIASPPEISTGQTTALPNINKNNRPNIPSKICIKKCTLEQEQILKDALQNVDVNSFLSQGDNRIDNMQMEDLDTEKYLKEALDDVDINSFLSQERSISPHVTTAYSDHLNPNIDLRCTTKNIEHEKIWKEALTDVDINALFSEEF